MTGLEWQDDAACLDEDPELFFMGTANANEAAKRVCAGRDVRAQCEQYAKDIDAAFGVWGKTTDRERAAMARTPRKIAQVALCGTYSGYARHQKQKERSCEPCKAAKAAYEKTRYQAADQRRKTLA